MSQTRQKLTYKKIIAYQKIIIIIIIIIICSYSVYWDTLPIFCFKNMKIKAIFI